MQVADDALGRVDAHVGHDQQRLEFLEHVLVDFAARGKIGEVVSEPAVALVQAGPQTLDEALPLLRLLLCRFFLFREHAIQSHLCRVNHLNCLDRLPQQHESQEK